MFQEKQEVIKIMKMDKRFFKNHQTDLKKEPNDESGNKGITLNIVEAQRD